MFQLRLLVAVVSCASILSVSAREFRDEMASNKVTYTDDYVQEASHRRSKRQTAPEPLTDTDKQEIVDKHNELRALEGSSNMFEMSWDQTLADLADLWLEQCRFDHGQPDEALSVYGLRAIGQNLLAVSGQGRRAKLPNRIKGLWYDEILDYDYDTNTCTPGAICGHYTQVVWRNSYKVGCGLVRCPVVYVDGANILYEGGFIFMCNYLIAGNFRGVTPYYIGTPCSLCDDLLPMGPNNAVTSQCCTDQGLCRPNCDDNGVASVADICTDDCDVGPSPLDFTTLADGGGGGGGGGGGVTTAEEMTTHGENSKKKEMISNKE